MLHLAAMRPPREAPGAVWVLSYLQHCRADLEARNLLGETPLVMAVRAALAHAPKGKGRSVEEDWAPGVCGGLTPAFLLGGPPHL